MVNWESEIFEEAHHAMKEIVDEAADRRHPTSEETVEKAIDKVEKIKEEIDDLKFEEEYIEELLSDLERIRKLTRSPKRSLDHMAVFDMKEEFIKKLYEYDYLS